MRSRSNGTPRPPLQCIRIFARGCTGIRIRTRFYTGICPASPIGSLNLGVILGTIAMGKKDSQPMKSLEETPSRRRGIGVLR